MSETKYVAVAKVDELPPGGRKCIEVEGRRILLCNSLDTIYAVINLCSHAHEPLENGRIKRGWIACPAHGTRFDLETGEPINPPATEPIETFPVRVSGDTIEIGI